MVSNTQPPLLAGGYSAATQDAWSQARIGLEAGQRGSFPEGRDALAEALVLDPSLVWAWEAHGLCAAALGDLSGAARSWETARQLDPTSDAGGWLRSLREGELHSATTAFNQALAAAHDSDFGGARRLLALSRTHTLDLVPAARLDELLELARDTAEVQPLREKPARGRWSVTPFLAGVTTATAVGLLLFLWLRPQGLTAGDVKAADMPTAAIEIIDPPAVEPTPDARRISRLMSAAVTGNQDSLAAAVMEFREMNELWTDELRLRAVDVLSQAGRRHYVRALVAQSSGNARLAMQEFADAADYGGASYYVDDALYALMDLHLAVGDSSAARAVAKRLSALDPPSPMANSRTRHIAGLFDTTPLP